MQVILLERIGRLGQMGDVVNVKNGYARNFLLPQKKALRATKENMAQFETQRAQLEANNVELKKEAEAVIPLEFLEATNLVGPESYVKERIAAFRESGVTNLQITPAADDPVALIAKVKELVSD